MGCMVLAVPSQRKPLPMPSNTYRSLKRDRTKEAGITDPAYTLAVATALPVMVTVGAEV